MMVGMAEMAVALHLIQTIKEMTARCQQTQRIRRPVKVKFHGG